MSEQWFNVDRLGLSKLIEQHGKGRLIAELIQNALDEEVTTVDATLSLHPTRAIAELVVEDDSPTGFRNLEHAYTLFAESHKKGDVTKRGRFNLGEKLVLAMCQTATIGTTTGTVTFTSKGRETSRKRRPRGSRFQAMLRMTRAEHEDAIAYLTSLLIPEGVKVTLNGQPIQPRKPIHSFETTLDTEIADDAGILRRRPRKTTVELYEPSGHEEASLYELGIPVVRTGDRWHVNVLQKVPLGLDRSNVPPAYLRALRTAVLNEMHDRITPDDANAVWVQQATASPDCSREAINAYLDNRFGTNRASYDPNDPEAGKAIQASGGTVVTGRMLSKAQWENAKRHDAILPVGQVMPTAKPYSSDPNAKPVDIVPPGKWSEGMRNIAEYACFLAKELMAVNVVVTFVNTKNNFAAAYGKRRLDFNVRKLGQAWFDQGPTEKVDALLIHEFGHEMSDDHLSEAYYDALCTLGARLKQLSLTKAAELRRFERQ